MKTFLHIDNYTINDNFDKEIALLTGNTVAMGIIETIKMLTLEEGMEKKSYEVVTNLLLRKKFSIPEIANIANVPEAFVKKVKMELGL